jgi:dienelactone hydrolase
MPDGIVYAGISLGAMPAQKLTQTRPGAAGAFLVASCVPPTAFGAPWPAGVPVQVHGMDADPIFVEEGDLDTARALVGSVDSGELFLYAGNGHLFIDNSLPGYDETATNLLVERMLAFLS